MLLRQSTLSTLLFLLQIVRGWMRLPEQKVALRGAAPLAVVPLLPAPSSYVRV